METSLTERSSAVSDRGRRSANQDGVIITDLPGGQELIAVADGMGGHAGGAIASATALQVLTKELSSGCDLAQAVRLANAAIFHESHNQPEYLGMGTTLVALLRNGESYLVANVGDSRAYRLDPGGLRQITEDHSFLAEALRSGVAAAEAEKSPWRNAVTRSVGTEPEVEVDCFGPFSALEAHTVLLCSDGLYKTISDAVLAELAGNGQKPAEVAKALAEAAFERGSDDNITVALVRFGG
jgi:PPM family protein phosphatase